MAASLAAPDPYGRLSRIRLPPWVLDGEALVRPGVEEARFGEPMIGELPDPLPGHAVLLAAPPERAPPEVHDVVSERCDGSHVGRDGVVVEEAGDHLLEPCALLADRPVHPPPQLRLHFLELRPHAVAPALPLDLELAGAGLAADVGESEEGEGLRFALSALFTVRRRKAAELDQAGLVRMERQRERLEPRSHRIASRNRLASASRSKPATGAVTLPCEKRERAAFYAFFKPPRRPRATWSSPRRVARGEKVPLNARRRLQHFQRPTPSHVSSIRRWVNHFGPIIAAELRKRRPKPHSIWHLDEVYLKIDGRMVYLWRAVDAEGEVSGCAGPVQAQQARRVETDAQTSRKYAVVPDRLVTDDLRSYRA